MAEGHAHRRRVVVEVTRLIGVQGRAQADGVAGVRALRGGGRVGLRTRWTLRTSASSRAAAYHLEPSLLRLSPLPPSVIHRPVLSTAHSRLLLLTAALHSSSAAFNNAPIRQSPLNAEP